jgi:hypothetical protein
VDDQILPIGLTSFCMAPKNATAVQLLMDGPARTTDRKPAYKINRIKPHHHQKRSLGEFA